MKLNSSSSYSDPIFNVDNLECGPAAKAARCLSTTINKLVNQLNNSLIIINNNYSEHNNDTQPEAHDQESALFQPIYGQQLRRQLGLALPGQTSAPSTSALVGDTAGALVGFVRLSLVILICVLVVKLRSVKKLGGQRVDGGSQQGGDNYGASHRHNKETKISGVKQVDRSNEFNLASDRNATKQPIRRHSQAAPAGHEQQSGERRRRHSDTTAAISKLQLPPGPMGLPFLGYLPFLGNEIHLTLTELSKKFGPIYQIFLGGIRVVVLNDAALVRQAFKQTVFSGRPDTQLTRILQGYGIVNSEGALWKEQRAFLHSALRKLGAKSLMSGSNGLESKIQVSV
jgi:hypothetical protein